jgi:hypothetical protein
MTKTPRLRLALEAEAFRIKEISLGDGEWRLGPTSRPVESIPKGTRSRGRIRLKPDVIVNRIPETLFAPEISLRRLN